MSNQANPNENKAPVQDQPLADPTPATSASPETEETTYSDSLEFDIGVIEKIVGITAKEVQGILAMKGSFISDLTQSFASGDDVTRGISAEIEEKDVVIDMKVILEFGSSAPAIFAEVKEKVRTSLKDMTGLNLQELNMRVVDVMTKKAYDEATKKSKDQAQQRAAHNPQDPMGYPGQPQYY